MSVRCHKLENKLKYHCVDFHVDTRYCSDLPKLFGQILLKHVLTLIDISFSV